jgi:CCR4-NOT transcription complex subunit 1
MAYPSSFLGMTIERFILYPPRNFTDDVKAKLVYAANLRYQKLN